MHEENGISFIFAVKKDHFCFPVFNDVIYDVTCHENQSEVPRHTRSETDPKVREKEVLRSVIKHKEALF